MVLRDGCSPQGPRPGARGISPSPTVHPERGRECGLGEGLVQAYGKDLTRHPNVRYHGRLDPSGGRYRRVVERCQAFVAPSCSEGISPATTTVMRTGLYPIISRETGVTLPEGHGTYLESCTIDEIVQACRDVAARSEESLQKDIRRARPSLWSATPEKLSPLT